MVSTLGSPDTLASTISISGFFMRSAPIPLVPAGGQVGAAGMSGNGLYKLDFNRAPEQARGERAPTQTAQRERYVPTSVARQAVEGREAEIVRALGIPWHGRGHISCPYPGHPDKDPSWRLREDGRAVCTCAGPHSVFDVVMHLEGLDFETAKIRVVELIDRDDLIVDPNNKPKALPMSGLTIQEYANAKGFHSICCSNMKLSRRAMGRIFLKP
jgi:hypothetical protein